MDPTVAGAIDPSTLAAGLLGSSSYRNPQFQSQAALDWRRRMAGQLMQPMQVHRPMEGAANIIRALVGGDMMYQANADASAAKGSYINALTNSVANARGDASGQPSATPSADGTPASTPNDVAKTAMTFYQGKGLSPVAAAGLAGGFANEGTPTSVAKGDGSDGSDSVGIGQWNGARAQALRQFASDNKLDPNNINTQLEFSWQELNGPEKATLAALNSAKTPQDGAIAAAGYERPAGWTPNNPTGASHFDQRLASTTALLSGGAGGDAAGAVNAVAGGPPAQSNLPSSATAFAGPGGSSAPAAPPAVAPPPANPSVPPMTPPASQPSPLPRVSGGQASPHDLAVVLGSDFGTPEGRDIAKGMIQPQVVSDSLGNSYLYRNGQPLTPMLSGTHVQMIEVGGQQIPISISGDPRNPTVTVLQPPSGGSPPAAGGVPQGTTSPTNPAPDQATRNGPISGYAPMIEQGTAIQAQREAQLRVAAASGDQLSKDRAEAGGYASSIFPLEHAIPALEALGPQGTGPGTEGWNRFKSTIQSLGLPGFDPAKITNYDEARQFLSSYASQHGGTSQLLSAFTSDPTTTMSNAAASDLTKSVLALRKMEQAKLMAFEQSGQPEADYSKFSAHYATSIDPRAFGVDHMSQSALNAMYASMPPGSPERKRFADSLRMAIGTHMITPPS